MNLTSFVSTVNPECIIQRCLIEEWPMTYLTTTSEGTEEVLNKLYFSMAECPTCRGTGRLNGKECPTCNGLGTL